MKMRLLAVFLTAAMTVTLMAGAGTVLTMAGLFLSERRGCPAKLQ